MPLIEKKAIRLSPQKNKTKQKSKTSLITKLEDGMCI